MNKCLNFSIVGLVKNHNPSILNPDFLERNEIVPKEWEWERGDSSITTPAFAVVEYKNGVTIFADTNKIQITDIHSVEPNVSKIQQVIDKYLRITMVSCTSIGINFLSVIGMEDDKKCNNYLADFFLKKDPWQSADHVPDSFGFQFVYMIDGVKLVLDIRAGTIITTIFGAASTDKGIVLSANFNKDSLNSTGEVACCLGGIPTHWKRYNEIIDKIKPELIIL